MFMVNNVEHFKVDITALSYLFFLIEFSLLHFILYLSTNFLTLHTIVKFKDTKHYASWKILKPLDGSMELYLLVVVTTDHTLAFLFLCGVINRVVTYGWYLIGTNPVPVKLMQCQT